MLRKYRVLTGLSILAIASIVLTQCYRVVWYSPAIEGVVIDQNTGKPVVGAIVYGTWQITGPVGETNEYMAMEETTTDRSGLFHVPAWGPRFHFGLGFIRYDQPILVIFRRGYFPITYYNQNMGDGLSGIYAPIVLEYWLNREKFEMQPVGDDIAAYKQAVLGNAGVLFLIDADYCYRRSLPLTFLEIETERAWLIAKGYGDIGLSFGPRQATPCSKQAGLVERLLR